jgi:hypothetical protein
MDERYEEIQGLGRSGVMLAWQYGWPQAGLRIKLSIPALPGLIKVSGHRHAA